MIKMSQSSMGFTLIELLVVIAIVGVLASVVLASINDARLAAINVAAKQELWGLKSGVQMLITDTGKSPNGCPYGRTYNPEVQLTMPNAGILLEPNVVNVGWGCEWTAEQVSKWNGPYAASAMDPWGNPYWYDPDYVINRHCPENFPEGPVIQAVVSRGPDNAWYTCDDIYLELR